MNDIVSEAEFEYAIGTYAHIIDNICVTVAIYTRVCHVVFKI